MGEVSKKDFKNGRIFCIRNHICDDIYIGSTTQPLSKRMQKIGKVFTVSEMVICCYIKK